jgi:uncharacterized protein YkwD
MGRRPGDKGAVAHKLSLALFAAALTCVLIAAPSAAASQPNIAKRAIVAAPSTTADQSAAEESRGLIASVSVCPGQKNLAASIKVQERAMHCMVAYARGEEGLTDLAADEALEQSAASKANDLISCDEFSHFACGRDFTHWMREAGYMSSSCWRVGENLAWGVGAYGTVRAIFKAWMSSPGHRQNILNDFTQTGLSLKIGTLAGQPRTHVWAQHFGTHCAAPPTSD